MIKKILTFPIKACEFIRNRLVLLFYHVHLGKRIEIRGFIFIRNHGEVFIGDHCVINSKMSSNPVGGPYQTAIAVKKGATLKIGNNVGISGTAIMCNVGINIGDNVKIGSGCCIYDTDFHNIDYALRQSDVTDIPKEAPVSIENNVFIGARSMVLKGVTIGEGSIVGAGTIVTKNVPPHELWCGNPAKFVKKV